MFLEEEEEEEYDVKSGIILNEVSFDVCVDWINDSLLCFLCCDVL
jgi:hypothetical protein